MARRPRGSGRVWRKGKYYWIQFYSNSGRQVRMSTKSPDEQVAERVLRKKIGQVAAGVDPDHRNLRYEDVKRSYIVQRMAGKSKSLPRKADGTFRLDEKDGLPIPNAVARLDKFFKGMKVRNIGDDELNKFIAEQQAEGYKPGTINRSTAALRAMLRLAQKNGKLNRVPVFTKLSEDEFVRSGYFDVADYRKLLAALPAHLKVVLALGFWCGLRAGEIFGLRWEQVDFFDRVIRLNPFETKSGEARTVPLSGELFSLLQAHRSACPPNFEYVCYQSGGTPERLKMFPARTWKRCCKAAGLSNRIFHDLRRSAVRNLVRAGVTEKVAMRISGHKTRSIFERYNIVDQRDLNEASRKLETYIKEVGAKTGQIEVPAEQNPQPN